MRRDTTPVDFYRADAYHSDESVGYLMRRVMTSIGQAADRRLEGVGLTNAQWVPLYKLHMGIVSTVAELARECQCDGGAMTRMLDRLETKGLIKRVRSTEDRRVVKLELTAEGLEAARQIPGVLCEVQNAHLAGFSKIEWQALKDYLRRMLANSQRLQPAVPEGAQQAG